MKQLSYTLAMLILLSSLAQAGEKAKKGEKVPALLNHKMNSLDGKEVDLSKYNGKVLLIVNVASKCGATPQYADLQALHEKYNEKGLVVLGFPCNQFGGQEPGTAKEISTFCTDNYGVTFDMFEKVDVNGKGQAPLFKQLTAKETNAKTAGPVRWNFEKFLINRDGEIVERFRTGVKPQSKDVTAAIEKQLKAE